MAEKLLSDFKTKILKQFFTIRHKTLHRVLRPQFATNKRILSVKIWIEECYFCDSVFFRARSQNEKMGGDLKVFQEEL